jgi:hypothetical protein
MPHRRKPLFIPRLQPVCIAAKGIGAGGVTLHLAVIHYLQGLLQGGATSLQFYDVLACLVAYNRLPCDDLLIR